MAHNRGERSAQLMTCQRQKFILEAIQLYQFLARLHLLRNINSRDNDKTNSVLSLARKDRNEGIVQNRFLLILRRRQMQFRQMKRFVSLYHSLPGAILLVRPRGDSQFVPFPASELVTFDVM